MEREKRAEGGNKKITTEPILAARVIPLDWEEAKSKILFVEQEINVRGGGTHLT